MPNALNIEFDTTDPTAANEYSLNGGSTFAPLPTTGTTTKTAALTGVPAATYAPGAVVVRPVGHPAKAISNPAAVTVVGAATAAPAGYTATPASATSISAALPAVSGATAYVFELALDAAFATGLQSSSQTGTTKDWVNLTPETPYFTRVKALFSSSPDSSYATANATTLAASAQAAAAPANFTQETASFTENVLTWSAVSGATYVLERATDSTFVANRTVVYSGGNTTFADGGLTSPEQYFYRLKARAVGLQDSAYTYTNAVPIAYRISSPDNYLTFANDADFALNTAAGWAVGSFVKFDAFDSRLMLGRSTTTARCWDISIGMSAAGVLTVDAQVMDATDKYIYRQVTRSGLGLDYFYLLVSFNGTAFTFYINGVEVTGGTVLASGGFTSTRNVGTFKVGKFFTYDTIGSIRLDDLFVMGRAITAAEVAELRNAPNAQKRPTVCSFYPAVIDYYEFSNNLFSARGTHNATATLPAFVVPVPSYTPSLQATAQGERYGAFDYGWLIHYGMNTYHGSYAALIGNKQAPPPASTFNTANVNVDAWVSAAVARGVKFAGLTIRNEYGFILYPSEVSLDLPQQTLNGYLSPAYTTPYCVQPGVADQNIVGKFVTKMRAAGIEPVGYIGLSGDLNIANGECFNQGYTAARTQLITNYFARVIAETVSKFGFKYLWFDMAGPGITTAQIQQWYDAAKNVDPDVQIVANVIGEANFEHFPYDIQSTEEYAILNSGNTVYQNRARTRNGVTYQIPQEIVATPFQNDWYYVDDTAPVQPPYTKNQAQPVATFQDLANRAQAANVPFLAGLMIDRTGAIVPLSINYLDQIDFGV